jgi:nucleoside 2-deoxyribosyltransferase
VTNPAIRCFVAMAVGRADTDRIYDKHILPTLRAAGIKAVFMGRLEHNDDIDKRIIREIEQCDFAIADLTYARPSVYFEAGYAQRKVPVIYTAQSDHLRPRHDDEFGNFRVHFDLLMRNIIPWFSPKDSSFAKKLSRRISKVVAPMLRQRQSDERSKAEEQQFQRLPLMSRLEHVTETFKNVLKHCGYDSLVVNDGFHMWAGRLPSRHTLNVGVVSVRASFTQNDLQWQRNNLLAMLRSRFQVFDDDDGYNRQRWQSDWHGYELPKLAETKNVAKVVARLVLCSLQRVPGGRLTSALSSFATNETGKEFTWQSHLEVGNAKSLPVSVHVYVSDLIKSLSDANLKGQELKRTIKAEH